MFMKTAIVAAAMFICLSVFAQPGQEGKRDRIVYLFTVMRQDSLVNKSFEIMTSSIANSMKSVFEDSLSNRFGVDWTGKYTEAMKKGIEATKEITKKMVHTDMVDVYEKYFTSNEIEDFIRFYSSPAGQKMLDRLPDIMQDLTAIMTTKYQPEILQVLQKDLEDILTAPEKQK